MRVFHDELKAHVNSLQSCARILNTNKGTIEYLYINRKRPVIVFIHGSPGGYDQFNPFVSDLVDSYSILSWSRPGYSRTPLTPLTSSFKDQALLLKELLDELHIRKVILYAVSGGGPVAYYFMHMFEGRCHGAILESCVSKLYEHREASLFHKMMNFTLVKSLGSWIMITTFNIAPRLSVILALLQYSSLSFREVRLSSKSIVSKKLTKNIFSKIVYSTIPAYIRIRGFLRDLEELTSTQEYPIGTTDVPCLILHGSHDTDVPVDHADLLYTKIQQATYIEIPQGSHLLPLSGRTVLLNEKRKQFIKRVLHDV